MPGFKTTEKPVKYSTENVFFERKYLKATNKQTGFNQATTYAKNISM